MKKFATQIYDAVKAGKLAEPFDAATVRRVDGQKKATAYF